MQAPFQFVRYRVPIGIAVVLVAVFIGVGAMFAGYFPLSGSSVTVTLVRNDAAVEWSLNQSDRENLTALAEKLRLPWQGQNLAVGLGEESALRLRPYLPVKLAVAASSPSELTLSGVVVGLPIGEMEDGVSGAEFLPPDVVTLAKVKGIQDRYVLSGKEVLRYLAGSGTLGLTLTDEGLGIIFIGKIKDSPELQSTLDNLKNSAVSPGPGYSGVEGVAAGWSEGTFEGIKLYTLSQPGLSYQPTFGILRDRLVAASSNIVWQSVKKALDTGSSLATNPRFKNAYSKLPRFSMGTVYLDLSAIAHRGEKVSKDLAGLVQLNLSQAITNSGLAGPKLGVLAANWIGLPFGQNRIVVRLLSDD